MTNQLKSSTLRTYEKIATHIVNTIESAGEDFQKEVANYINSSRSKGTFNSRLSAVKYYLSDDPEVIDSILSQVKKPSFEKVKSKRLDLKKLPTDWQTMMVEKLKKTGSTYVKAIAILQATGCRPIELENGVHIEKAYEGDFVITVKSAKGRDGFERKVTSSLPILAELFSEEETVKAKSKRLAEVLYTISRTLGMSISAYTYRHAFASDLKASGLAKDEIAMCMGHRALKSQRSYGFKRAGEQTFVKSVEVKAIKSISHDMSM